MPLNASDPRLRSTQQAHVASEGITLFWYDPLELDIPRESTREHAAELAQMCINSDVLPVVPQADNHVEPNPASPTEARCSPLWPIGDQVLLCSQFDTPQDGSVMNGVTSDVGDAPTRGQGGVPRPTPPLELDTGPVALSTSQSTDVSAPLTPKFTSIISVIDRDPPLYYSDVNDSLQYEPITWGALPPDRSKVTFALPRCHSDDPPAPRSKPILDLDDLARPPPTTLSAPSRRANFDTNTRTLTVCPGQPTPSVAESWDRVNGSSYQKTPARRPPTQPSRSFSAPFQHRIRSGTNGVPLGGSRTRGKRSIFDVLACNPPSKALIDDRGRIPFYVVTDLHKDLVMAYITNHGGVIVSRFQEAEVLVFLSRALRPYEQDAFLYLRPEQKPIELDWIIHSVQRGKPLPSDPYTINCAVVVGQVPRTSIPYQRKWWDETGLARSDSTSGKAASREGLCQERHLVFGNKDNETHEGVKRPPSTGQATESECCAVLQRSPQPHSPVSSSTDQHAPNSRKIPRKTSSDFFDQDQTQVPGVLSDGSAHKKRRLARVIGRRSSTDAYTGKELVEAGKVPLPVSLRHEPTRLIDYAAQVAVTSRASLRVTFEDSFGYESPLSGCRFDIQPSTDRGTTKIAGERMGGERDLGHADARSEAEVMGSEADAEGSTDWEIHSKRSSPEIPLALVTQSSLTIQRC